MAAPFDGRCGFFLFSLAENRKHVVIRSPSVNRLGRAKPMKFFYVAPALLLPSVAFAQPQCAGTGVDYSANAATIPQAGFVLLATVPVACFRNSIEIQNQSAGTIQVVRDAGNGTQLTSMLLTGSGTNQQGGDWLSTTFKGRILVYGASGAQVGIAQE